MNWLDLVLLIIIAANAYTGFRIGFARVGIGFIAAALGLLCGFWFYGIPAAWLGSFIPSKPVANLLGFFVVIFGFILAGSVIGYTISKMFKMVGLGLVDRTFGAAFGIIRGGLVVVALVVVLLAFTPKNPPPDFILNSAVMPYAMDASRVIVSLAPRGLNDSVEEAIHSVKKIWDDRMKKLRSKKKPAETEV